MTELDDLSVLREKPLLEALARLDQLLSSCGRVFLLGAGTSKCAGLPLTAELTASVLSSDNLGDTSKEILRAVKTLFDGSINANIEDYLSEIIDLVAIAQRRDNRGARQHDIHLAGNNYDGKQLVDTVEEIKESIAECVDRPVTVKVHRDFVRDLHKSLRPGTFPYGRSITYLILNYDTLVEDALALERITYADGMRGGVTGWWDPSTFSAPDVAARVCKLHGSVNWREFQIDNPPLPRRVGNRVGDLSHDPGRILIWPASTKYRETQLDPYAQLMDLARRSMRRDDGSQLVLTISGYSFSDSHINIEIDRALRAADQNLTVAIFTNDNEPTGIVKKWCDEPVIGDRILVFANRGFFHGAKATTATTDLPWWKFEVLARLIGGER